MNKIVRFHAALIMMCVVALSVSLGSCDKNEDTPYQEETPYSFRADTNGVGITVVPFLKWGCDISEIKEYVAQFYPDWVAKNDGKLYLDTCDGCWTLKYYENGKDSSYVWFDFVGENGNTFNMTGICFYKSGDIQKIRDEIERQGFKYKGMLYWEIYPLELTYLYLSADEKLEVQLYANNVEGGDYWGITFQPTDKDDFNHLIDASTLSLNINSVNDSCCVTPLMDWGVSFTDVKRFMTQNYPDWELQNNGELICDTISEDSLEWYAKYQKGDFRQFFYFNNADGERYLSFQFGDYASTDEIPLDRELTRNGLVYMGRDTTYYEEGISNHVYVPLSKDYIAVASAWIAHGGCRIIGVGPYDEEYLKLIKRD